ncbi:hypothetical protein FRC19_007384 [Serendipita sp. 401]|nr:hypothetical protein FRC19_007384 [Serendipita sp. 401]KAG9057297.1 hypothetical protein FS842_007655 [Serendipita sp. 407]
MDDGLVARDLERHSSNRPSLFDTAGYFNSAPDVSLHAGSINWALHTSHFVPTVGNHSATLPTSVGTYPTISDSHSNGTEDDLSGSGRVLTRRQRAAMSVGRGMDAAASQMISIGDDLQYFGLNQHLNTLSAAQGPRPVSPTAHFSANPADISPVPLSRRTHTRHASLNSAFDPEPLGFSPPPSAYARHSRVFDRESSPASSIASSSITSLSGSLSQHSQSTWSSTNESPSSRLADVDDLSSSASPEGNKSAREKHVKSKLRNSDRKDMCLYYEQNPTARQEDIAAKFGVERSTVSKVLKQKALWLSIEDEDELKIAKRRPTKFPEIETAVLRWVQERFAMGESVTDQNIREQAKQAAHQLGIGEELFKASGGWIDNFKHRNRIKRGRVHPARSERSHRVAQSEGRISVASSTDEAQMLDGVDPLFSALSVDPIQSPIPQLPNDTHSYGTRSKTINAFQLQQSIATVRSFMQDVYPQGFTDGDRALFNSIEERTMRWAMEQMRRERQ